MNRRAARLLLMILLTFPLVACTPNGAPASPSDLPLASAPDPVTIAPLQALRCEPGGGFCLGGHAAGLSRSTDAGATWQALKVDLGGRRVAWFSCGVVKSPTYRCLAYLRDSGADRAGDRLLVSEDNGLNWSESTATAADPSLLLPENCQVGACFRLSLAGGKIERSANGGTSWNPVTGDFGVTAANSIAWRPVPIRVFAAENGLVLFRLSSDSSLPAGVWRSEDGGISWQPLLRGLESYGSCRGGSCLAFGGLSDPETGSYVVTIAGSTNGGQTLKAREIDAAAFGIGDGGFLPYGGECSPDGALCALSLAPDYGDTERPLGMRLGLTGDGGASWTFPSIAPLRWVATTARWTPWLAGVITFADAKTILLFDAEGRLWRSPDLGVSWGRSTKVEALTPIVTETPAPDASVTP